MAAYWRLMRHSVHYDTLDCMGNDQRRAPKCERCLIRMILDGTTKRPYWRCGNCGAVRIS
jgi:tRNA(Ile2) C34 agmatinyltransferase TiaS